VGLVLVAWAYGLQERPLPTSAALLTIGGGIVAYRVGRSLGWLEHSPDWGS
jgi:hypothetical protein